MFLYLLLGRCRSVFPSASLLALVAVFKLDKRNTFEKRIALVGFVDYFLEIIVSNNGERVNVLIAGALTAVRQAQTASNSLLNENSRIGGSERNNRV